MLNHHRGLWGYSGPAADGAPLTIQSTGLGGPSAAAVVAELIALGARRLVRVGTAAGLGATGPGTLVVVREVIAADGASRALGAGARVAADPALTAALAVAAGRSRRWWPRPTSSTRSSRARGQKRAPSPPTSPRPRCSPRRSAAGRRPPRCSVSRARGRRWSTTTGLEALEARLGAVAMAAIAEPAAG